MTGAFITIEGIDGCGKSTALSAIEDRLTSRGIPYVRTREPGGTPMAEEIREILLRRREEEVGYLPELLLVYAARALHVANTIKPALARGEWVISDRWVDSTVAYQCFARGGNLSVAMQLNGLVLQKFSADKTILLDVSVEIARQRAATRSALDRFELENIEFHERTRAGFLYMHELEPDRITVVDAGQDADAVARDVSRVIDLFIDQRLGRE